MYLCVCVCVCVHACVRACMHACVRMHMCMCSEIAELKKLLKDYNVQNFKPTKEVLETYMDGGVAIIDQWICAHARSVDVYIASA